MNRLIAGAPENQSSLKRLTSCFLLGAALLLTCGAGNAQDDAFGANWPAGEGRELTGAWCGGCHSLNLVKQQGLTRAAWDELLYWMTQKQNMPPLKDEMRDTVLTYLTENFGVDNTGGGVGVSDEGYMAPLNPVQGIQRPLLDIRKSSSG